MFPDRPRSVRLPLYEPVQFFRIRLEGRLRAVCSWAGVPLALGRAVRWGRVAALCGHSSTGSRAAVLRWRRGRLRPAPWTPSGGPVCGGGGGLGIGLADPRQNSAAFVPAWCCVTEARRRHGARY